MSSKVRSNSIIQKNSKMKQQLLFLVLAIANVSNHAYLAKPASRASAWRIFPGQRPSICGICGPIYNGKVTWSFRVIIPLLYRRYRQSKPSLFWRRRTKVHNWPNPVSANAFQWSTQARVDLGRRLWTKWPESQEYLLCFQTCSAR